MVGIFSSHFCGKPHICIKCGVFKIEKKIKNYFNQLLKVAGGCALEKGGIVTQSLPLTRPGFSKVWVWNTFRIERCQ